MRKDRVFSLVAAALVAGLALGAVGFASATPASQNATGTAGIGGGFGRICRDAGASLVDVVAKLTGASATEVRAERQAGKTFTQIADEKGVSADQVETAAIDAREAALDAAVQDGRITQAQADAMMSRMKDRVRDRIDSVGACGGGAGGGGFGGRGGRGSGGCGGNCALQQ